MFSASLLLLLVTSSYHLTFVECSRYSKKMEDLVTDDIRQRTLDISNLNQKAVGIMLKTNGRRYYVSSELCPGGIFLSRPVNENCLCYNGIFQVVRQCCDPKSTRIEAEQLEWRLDLKCGISTGDTTAKPIRAILPLTKTYNRFASVIMSHSLSGRNISKWRKFDLDDVIIRNRAELSMLGRRRFEIVNVKPLGREVTIRFAEKNRTLFVCYSGWHTRSPSSLRVVANDAVGAKGCCFNITESNTPGDIKADCGEGTITTDIVEVPSADIDIGHCEQDFTAEEGQHKIAKRNPIDFAPTSPFEIKNSLSGPPPKQPITSSRTENSGLYIEDVLGDRGLIDLTRLTRDDNRDIAVSLRLKREDSSSTNDSQSTLKVIIPRKVGIANADEYSQAKAIATFVAIIRNDPTAEIEPAKTFRYQLLKRSVDVFLAVVPDSIVPHIMAKTAYDVFYYLYEAIESVTYDAPAMHTKAMDYLENCMNNSHPINFTTIGCPREIDQVIITKEIREKMESYYHDRPEELRVKIRTLKHVDIQRNKRFIPELYDIYVDINWKILDFVHSFCFDYFKEDFNIHHFYETELEKLFLYPEVQLRWFAKRPKGLQYVQGIFPVTKLEMRMKQLDKVAAVGHHLSRYNGSYWLFRPKIDPFFARKHGLSSRSEGLFVDEKRNVFNRNVMDETRNEAGDRLRTASGRRIGENEKIHSNERGATYPYHIPEKLPPGEIIWDGKAICLHAHHSDEKGYFTDSKKWGMNPSLIDLGKLYPLDLD